MFQYAAARRLAHMHNTELRLDITGYANTDQKDTPRSYELNCFKINAGIATAEDLSRVKSADHVRKFHEKVARRLGTTSAIYQYGEPGPRFDERAMRMRDNTYLTGWWQNEKYFVDIKNILQKEFLPKTKPTGNNIKWLEQAKSTNSISVHVRRSDYLTNKHANVFHGLASIDYYNAAALCLKTLVNNPHFFIFSDDIDWCRRTLKLGKNVTFVKGNDGSKAYEDLRIMGNCQHNIIANSSFSWWGAWLNQNKDKVVIAPRVWFQDKKANRETEIVPNNWMKM